MAYDCKQATATASSPVVSELVADQFGSLASAHLVVDLPDLQRIHPFAFRGVAASTSVDITQQRVLSTLSDSEINSISWSAFMCSSIEAIDFSATATPTCENGFLETTYGFLGSLLAL